MKFSIIDFVYFFVAKMYSNAKEKGFKLSAIGVHSLVFTSHLISIMILISFYLEMKVIFKNKIWIILIFISFEVLNYFRYIKSSKRSLEAIQIDWDSKVNEEKVKYRLLSLLYVVLSIAVMFTLAILLGRHDFN
jgi:hypothetical protein